MAKSVKQKKNRATPTYHSRFKPGVSGNPRGRPPNTKYLSEYLTKQLLDIDPETKKTYGELIALTTIKDALKGKPDARALVWERIEGKVVQPIGGDADNPVTINIVVPQKRDNGHGDNGNGRDNL